MQYRYITNDKIKVSKLGFGMMRLPVVEGNNGKIDKIEAMKILKYAYENGVNYFDTAYVYHDETSESMLKDFIKEVGRENILIADKLPVWLCETYEDFEKYLDIQLDRLGTSYIDFYLTHSLSKKTFENMSKNNVYKFLDMAKISGKIKYAGFSFHDEYDVFEKVVDIYDWDFCQIQLNYLDTEYQAGLKGLKYARDKNLDVIIMEPMKGGSLINLPKDALKITYDNCPNISPAKLAQKWVYEKDISLILSGMSTMDMVRENMSIASLTDPIVLSESEKNAAKEVKKLLDSRVKVPCTECNYCMPCPSGVSIPDVFSKYNKKYVFEKKEKMEEKYKKMFEEGKDASKCVECGLCEKKCPQTIKIITKLKDAHKDLI
ncbi:aldo/keto reductase [Citroniella saccharovorans]|uniref:Aldo/keto reductase n=1 Tax=Citroniella saccharovorans TaxID=2053367 RepID=A0AAW9MV60_9FIRM|nr:aldo/keto reductase [Citroniella saccharovorans]MEB3430061.1 aldo/keto reductase [Citroniella saccharovorans]